VRSIRQRYRLPPDLYARVHYPGSPALALFLCFAFHHRALTVLAKCKFPNVDVIEGDPVVPRHVSLTVSLEVFNDGRGLHPPHQLPEGGNRDDDNRGRQCRCFGIGHIP
jgi:hypothetical protein